MKQLINMCKLSYSGKEIMKNAQTLSIIGELCRLVNINQHSDTTTTINPHYHSIVKSIEYMHLNYQKKITINDLADYSHLSRSTYIRNFKCFSNKSPYEYLLAYRILKAKDMLRFSDKSITQIALDCGFYDSSHFQKYFIQEETITPHQYRKLN